MIKIGKAIYTNPEITSIIKNSGTKTKQATIFITPHAARAANTASFPNTSNINIQNRNVIIFSPPPKAL